MDGGHGPGGHTFAFGTTQRGKTAKISDLKNRELVQPRALKMQTDQ